MKLDELIELSARSAGGSGVAKETLTPEIVVCVVPQVQTHDTDAPRLSSRACLLMIAGIRIVKAWQRKLTTWHSPLTSTHPERG